MVKYLTVKYNIEDCHFVSVWCLQVFGEFSHTFERLNCQLVFAAKLRPVGWKLLGSIRIHWTKQRQFGRL